MNLCSSYHATVEVSSDDFGLSSRQVKQNDCPGVAPGTQKPDSARCAIGCRAVGEQQRRPTKRVSVAAASHREATRECSALSYVRASLPETAHSAGSLTLTTPQPNDRTRLVNRRHVRFALGAVVAILTTLPCNDVAAIAVAQFGA